MGRSRRADNRSEAGRAFSARQDTDAELNFEVGLTSLPWWADRRLRLGLLLACLLAAVFVLLNTRGSWFGIGGAGGAQAGLLSIPAGCLGRDAPQPRTVAAADLRTLREQLSPIVPNRVGRVYEAGPIATANLWSDDTPRAPPSSADTPTQAGYEIRWWALDREGAEDDIVADVLEFATARAATQTLKLASISRCRRDGASQPLRYPRGASELTWVNADGAHEWDVLFARGHRLYRIADVPPEYLLTTTPRRQVRRERLRAGATPSALACALALAGCPSGAAAVAASDLAKLPRSRSIELGRSPSRAQAIAYAHAVNLRGYHVPGMSELAPEQPASERDYWEEFARCAGALRSTQTVASIRSPLFRRLSAGSYEVVYSTVVVFPSATLASHYLATVATAHARSCITREYLQRSATQQAQSSSVTRGMHLSAIAAVGLTTPVPHSYRGFGPYRATALRLNMQASYITHRNRHGRLALYIEGFAFANGRAVVELASLALPHQFPQADEHFLEGVLVGRAEADEGLL